MLGEGGGSVHGFGLRKTGNGIFEGVFVQAMIMFFGVKILLCQCFSHKKRFGKCSSLHGVFSYGIIQNT